MSRKHALQSRGAPYVGEGIGEVPGPLMRNTYDGLGVAICKCGWRSPVFWTSVERRAAYAEHRAAPVEGGAA